jgi:hypothetical protein
MLSLEDEANAAKLVREILAANVLLTDVDNAMKADDVHLSAERVANALRQALQNPDTNDFDAGVVTAAAMLREGERLPEWLALFAADVLEGKRKRPTKRGPDKYANWLRDYAVARAVLEVASRFGLPEYTKNELSDKITAAQIVAKAAHLSLEVVHHAVRRFGGRIKRETSPQDTKI